MRPLSRLIPVDPSRCAGPDGRELTWSGFFTGPTVLGPDGLARLARGLLGLDLAEVGAEAGRRLLPLHPEGALPPALIVHSTTPSLRAFEAELADLAAGAQPYDVATYTEARSAYLAGPDDLCVGRTAPWLEAVQLRGAAHVDVGDREHYYLSQALLVLAEEHRADATPLGAVVDWLAARPHAVVRVYAMDTEVQIFLLWLLRQTGLATVCTDANAPSVAARWNTKSHIHPTVADADPLDTDGLDVDQVLAAEQRQGAAYRWIGLQVPVLPGYLIPRTDGDAGFVADVLRGAQLLSERYGLTRAGLKPCEAGDGARIEGDLDLTDTAALTRAAQACYVHGDDYVLEAWAVLATIPWDGPARPVAPSGHFRNGRLADGLTLQRLDGYAWIGNAYVDAAGWGALGLPADAYRTIRQALFAVDEAFGDSGGGLVTGGIDFAVGRLGGRFGERLVIGAVDFNFSSNGAEYVRAFRAEAGARYAATRVLRPAADSSLAQLDALLAQSGDAAEAIACVPGRWAMIACAADEPATAMRRVDELADELQR